MSEPILGIDDLKLGYVTNYGLASALASGATTAILTGEGADFAAASVSEPMEITFVTAGVGEKALVTARTGNDLTVTRAQMGTTAVAHTTGSNVVGIRDVDMGMAQDLMLDPNIDTIEYNGDGTTVRIPVSSGVSGTMAMEFWTKEFLEYAAGVTRHTTNLPPDETARSYPQLGTYPFVRIRGKIRVIETSAAGVSGHWRLEVPKAIIQRPVTFGSIASGEPTTFEFAFTAFPTRTDISGAVLPHVDADDEVEMVLAELVA
jgi:hypothetical protein